MELQIAELLKGSETPAGDGITGALRCVLILPDGNRRAAVLKRGPIGQVAAEAFSALLLRKWGLTVPQPFLVEEPTGPSFASADATYPNLKQHLGLEGLPEGVMRDAAIRIACNLACELPNAPLAAACDEAIDNRDRNLGNILWDGQADAWIDHAFALGQGLHFPDENKLCRMAIGSKHEDRICRGAVAQSLVLDRNALSGIDIELATKLPIDGLAAFVADRVSSLGNRLLARFPQVNDLLASA